MNSKKSGRLSFQQSVSRHWRYQVSRLSQHPSIFPAKPSAPSQRRSCRSWASGGSRTIMEKRCSQSMGGSGRKGSHRRVLPIRRGRSMASVTRSFSIVFKPTPTFLTRSLPTSKISLVARSRCALRDCRAASIRAPDPVQSQAKWRLPDHPRELPRKQFGAVEVRKGQALVGQMGA